MINLKKRRLLQANKIIKFQINVKQTLKRALQNPPKESQIIDCNECTFRFILLRSAPAAEYTEYAEVVVSKTGHRQLWLGGHKFSKYYLYGSDETVWKCTRRGAVDANGVRKGQCAARIKTKQIGGYEMIKTTKCAHEHNWFLIKTKSWQKKPLKQPLQCDNKPFFIRTKRNVFSCNVHTHAICC